MGLAGEAKWNTKSTDSSTEINCVTLCSTRVKSGLLSKWAILSFNLCMGSWLRVRSFLAFYTLIQQLVDVHNLWPRLALFPLGFYFYKKRHFFHQKLGQLSQRSNLVRIFKILALLLVVVRLVPHVAGLVHLLMNTDVVVFSFLLLWNVFHDWCSIDVGILS